MSILTPCISIGEHRIIGNIWGDLEWFYDDLVVQSICQCPVITIKHHLDNITIFPFNSLFYFFMVCALCPYLSCMLPPIISLSEYRIVEIDLSQTIQLFWVYILANSNFIIWMGFDRFHDNLMDSTVESNLR